MEMLNRIYIIILLQNLALLFIDSLQTKHRHISESHIFSINGMKWFKFNEDIEKQWNPLQHKQAYL